MREVTKTARLQRRHLFFWLLLVVFASGLIYLILNSDNLFASTPDVVEEVTTGNALTAQVTVGRDGATFVNNVKTNKILRLESEFDELRYKIIDKPGTFIDQLIVKVSFTNSLPANTKLKSYAVHGIDQATEKQLDEHTLEYTATGIGPEAIYTIDAEIPPGSLDWSASRRFAAAVNNLPIQIWLTLAIAMPLLTLFILLAMFWGSIADRLMPAKGTIIAPPQDLAPAVTGILIHGRVSAREIAATILDLAHRGYLSIFSRGPGHYSIAKRRSWQNLEPFELLLLMQLFHADSYKSSGNDIELSVGKTLFSPEVARVYVAMYDAATAAGYFTHNPAAVHQKYRLTGLFLFFVGLGAFTAALLTNVQPTYLLFLFAGMMTMALVIIIVSDDVPLLTPAGYRARREWLAFSRYLSSPVLVGYVEGAQDFYERYLPYAVVLKVEIPWVNRFREHPFKLPTWYDATDPTIPIEEFAQVVYQIVGTIAELFAAVKEPNIN